jgi:phosphomannomutase
MALPEIKFGTDGWRGITGDDFTYASVRRVAKGVAEYMKSRSREPLAVVGYDCRFASEEFARTVADVFAANGLKSLIFDRPSPTQVASWTVIDRKATGAVAITASHNPYLFNGVKYKPETGSSAPTEVIKELEQRINALGEVERPDREKVESLVTVYDPRGPYYEQVGKIVDLAEIRNAGLKVVHETMHGSGYGYIKELIGGGKTTVTELHADRNPFFGGHPPEPIPPNIDEAIAVMKKGGNVFDVMKMTGPIVKTVNMTEMVEQLARQFHTEIYEVPVGFKWVAPKMMETNAVIGGEESGGFGLRGHIPERDGILVGLLFADMIVRRGKPLSRILEDLEARVGPHAYARHDIHLNRDTYDRDRKRITEQLASHQPKEIAGVKVERVRDDDGFKFYLADGSWVLFRTSGTEALIRIYAEASDADAVEKRLQAIEDIVGLKKETGVHA